ncbi:MAG: beta-ketoacyl-ACP synthase III [Bdellovibrionota bacterium]
MNTRIVSFGHYVPPKVVTNKDLEKMMETSDEWIQQRSGIKERRWVEKGVDTTLSMATKACEEALKKANLKADDIDAIIFGALLSDYVFPGTGCLLQQSLGFKNNIPALDIRNQCSAFLYSLSIANAWIKSGMYKRVLIVGSEIHSNRLDKSPTGRDVGVLFGDGAGACIVEATKENTGVIDIHIASQGAGAGILCIKEPASNIDLKEITDFSGKEFYPHMEGKVVFKNAIERMTQSMTELLHKNNLKTEDVDFVIAHQANMRINAMVLEQLKIPWEKTHHTLDRYGNTTAATIPLTMNEAIEQGKIKRGDTVALVAFGAGFTWGSAILKY